MIEVNEALTRKIADLARLDLSDAEVKTFTSQLGQILGYVDQLGSAQVKTAQGEVEPLTHPLDLPTLYRDDVVRSFEKDPEGKPKVLTAAPEVIQDGFKVPPIL
jgi:aspartyl-tRNA(Asn)/glutamyl-tRNA(Gln) amidotransferase subunit C